MERFVVVRVDAWEVIGWDRREVVAAAVGMVGAFAAEEEREAELQSPGVVDAFHCGEDGLGDLTLFMFFNEVADGDAVNGLADVFAWARGGGSFVFGLLVGRGRLGGGGGGVGGVGVGTVAFFGAEEVVGEVKFLCLHGEGEGCGVAGDESEVVGGCMTPLGEVVVRVGGEGGVGDGRGAEDDGLGRG